MLRVAQPVIKKDSLDHFKRFNSFWYRGLFHPNMDSSPFPCISNRIIAYHVVFKFSETLVNHANNENAWYELRS